MSIYSAWNFEAVSRFFKNLCCPTLGALQKGTESLG